MPSTFLPQGLCTCHAPCQEQPFSRSSHNWFLLIGWVSAPMLLTQSGLPWPPDLRLSDLHPSLSLLLSSTAAESGALLDLLIIGFSSTPGYVPLQQGVWLSCYTLISQNHSWHTVGAPQVFVEWANTDGESRVSVLSGWMGQWHGDEAAASACALPWVNRPPSAQTATVWELSAEGPAKPGLPHCQGARIPWDTQRRQPHLRGSLRRKGWKSYPNRREEGPGKRWDRAVGPSWREARGAEGGPGTPSGQLPEQGQRPGCTSRIQF